MVEPLVDAVIGKSRGRLALDLFAGVGLFTVALTKQFERVIGVESNLAAAKDLETNLKESGGALLLRATSPRRDFFRAGMRRPIWWSSIRRAPAWKPKRSRTSRKLAPARIHYVSCDPATLGARSRATRWHERTQPARSRSRVLICLTFSHKPIIWRCWCGSNGAHEASFPLPRRPFRRRNSPLDRVAELCPGEPAILLLSRLSCFWLPDYLALRQQLDFHAAALFGGWRMALSWAGRLESGTRVRPCQILPAL